MISRELAKELTARDDSSEVEKATNPEPLRIPFGSHITCIIVITKTRH